MRSIQPYRTDDNLSLEEATARRKWTSPWRDPPWLSMALCFLAVVVFFAESWTSPRTIPATDDSKHLKPILGLGALDGKGMWVAHAPSQIVFRDSVANEIREPLSLVNERVQAIDISRETGVGLMTDQRTGSAWLVNGTLEPLTPHRGHAGPLPTSSGYLSLSRNGEVGVICTPEGFVDIVRPATKSYESHAFLTVRGITNVAVNPSGQTLAVADARGTIYWFDLISHQILGWMSRIEGRVFCLEWSRDGEWLFAGTERGSLAVFDGITRTMVAEQSLGPSGILAICWMEQESAVAAGTVEGRVCLLDVPSLAIRAQCRPHHAVIRALAVDDEGTLWSGATDGRVMRTRLVNDRFTNSQEL
ncbi:MAG: WD40 repeat domain-containing protein [Planctomycetaceae bacterium]|nr:WD40 repeat domain-containing protein [Planctomycetaceae bacterium]